MSDIQNTHEVVENPVIPPTTSQDTPEQITTDEAPISTEAPVIETKPEEATADGQLKDEAATEKNDESEVAAEKVVEPISEGQLTYKGPGLLK